MGKWVKVKLGNVCQISKGQQLNKVDLEKTGDYPCINGGIEPSGYTDKWNTEANTITISEGGNSCGYVNFISTRFWSGGHCYSLLELNDKIDAYFLYHALKGRESLIMVLRVGSGLPNIQQKAIKDFDFEIPESKAEQTRIAQILSTADKAIAQTEALIAKYQRIKTGLMHDLLTRGIDEHGRIRSKATHRFVVKNGIEVPEEWEVLEIGEITEHVGSGITPKGGSNVYGHEGILLIRSQNVLVGEFNLDDVAFITPEINQRMLRSELQDLDVLLNITGASIGRSHFVPINFPKSNVNQHVCALRIKNKSVGKSLFVSSFLNSYEGQKQIKRLLGASNREGLNYQQIREIKIPIPKLDDDTEYQNIYFVLSSINKKMETLKTNWKKLHSLKTGLMQDLLSGRVRVKVPENENEKEQQNV